MDGQRSVNDKSSKTGKGDVYLTATKKKPICGIKTCASDLSHGSKLMKIYGSPLKSGFVGWNQYARRDKEEAISYVGDIVDTENHITEGANLLRDVSANVVDFLNDRQLGNIQHSKCMQSLVMLGKSFQCQTDFPMRHLITNNILQEKSYLIENMDKVFCSQWLSDRKVLFGTKCNKLMLLDVQTSKATQIQSLSSSPEGSPVSNSCGVHAIQANPSRSFVATSGTNPNDLAIYKLENMEPYNLGQFAHRDWISSLAWLEDDVLVSGSCDSTLALWKIFDHSCDEDPSKFSTPNKTVAINAAEVKQCKSADKVRDLVFNRRLYDIACVSPNNYIHTWSSDTFVQKYSKKISPGKDTVCLSVHEDYNLYASGSSTHLVLIDARNLNCASTINFNSSGFGIRSISFNSSILIIGTGKDTVVFFDLRAGKFLKSNTNLTKNARLMCSNRWIRNNEYARPVDNCALYTHCVDVTGTRIFVAGGPTDASSFGNYVSMWH